MPDHLACREEPDQSRGERPARPGRARPGRLVLGAGSGCMQESWSWHARVSWQEEEKIVLVRCRAVAVALVEGDDVKDGSAEA